MLVSPPLHAALVEMAPAKINLALHVTGQREDGYHLLETLVTFADTGDRLFFSEARADEFSMSGRFSADLGQDGSTNLVLRARDLLRACLHRTGQATTPVAIHLEKNLPIASGIGGGSADAAAAIRGLLRFWRGTASTCDMDDIALQLGADVPMCLNGKPLIARGIGEEIEELPHLPSLALVLANPLIHVSTPQIFRNLASKNNSGFHDHSPSTRDAWLPFIRDLRNDLQPPAAALCDSISEVTELLQSHGADIVRMSGSGATCFGMFRTQSEAVTAAAILGAQRPEWYFVPTMTAGIRYE